MVSIVGVGDNSDGFFLFEKDSFDILLASTTVNIYTVIINNNNKILLFLVF